MNTSITGKPLRKTTIVAGITFLCGLIIPILSAVFVYSKLNVDGNPVTTANNIIANAFLFRLGIASDLIMVLNNILLSVSLYVILKTVRKNVAMLALFVRMGDAALWGVASVGGLIALLLLNGNAYSAVFGTDQVKVLAGIFFDIRNAVSSIAFAFLGVGMTISSYLFLRSKFVPGVLAVLGIVSYILIFLYSFVKILLPGYADMTVVQIIFYTPSCIFEFAIGLWLIIKGVKVEKPAQA